jgi:hypothetical protein
VVVAVAVDRAGVQRRTWRSELIPAETSPEYKHRPGGETMRALAWFGKEDVRLVDAPIPDITEPKDVVLKVTGTTICGSDLHLYHSEMLGLQKGDIFGHEFM